MPAVSARGVKSIFCRLIMWWNHHRVEKEVGNHSN